MDLTWIISLAKEEGTNFLIAMITLFFAFQYVKIKLEALKNKNNKNSSQLNPEIVENIVYGKLEQHNKSKLQMIKSILVANHIKGREDEIRLKVENLLDREMMVYIDWFNTLNTPIHSLGDWYRDNFDYEDFLKDIMEVILRPYEDKIPEDHKQEAREYLRLLLIGEKVEDISNIMLKYQNDTHIKLVRELKKSK